ncbi:hypothetical protein ED733_007169 [Metarhizium rileyi]|uniref:Major facilitator superfamily (MFS) profile domain-containing protein n=1 Tax=Metarhizium rileyi (strain RCEF 4871) TaxID=1649241 RepID=A0A5C6GGW4_METRR|nr:hypothetical protein ED733_007169 [Metarhizium rileyi]
MAASAVDVETVGKHAHEDGECFKNSLYNDSTAVVDRAAERRLCFKFDIRILPVLAVMYLFNALDKGNLSNVQTNGLGQELNFKKGQYNLVVSIFFVPFVIFAPPLAMLGKKYGPARALPIMMLALGSMTLFTAACQNFSGIFAVRWFLGMAEAAFFPMVIYYLTTFYRRGELARRLAVFYAASNVANAFSGLLAFVVFRIQSRDMDSWRYLFLIEGSATVLFAVFALWYLPRRASEAKFLTKDEKSLAFHRIQVDSSSVVSEKFSFKEALQIFTYPSSYAFLAIEVCLGVPLQSVALFLPQIIQRLGFSTVKTNLYTVAPNVTGAAMLLVLAFASDYTRLRFPFIVLGYALTFAGFIIYAAIADVHDHMQLAYFATFMMCWGTSAPSVLLSTWYSNNIAHEDRRVTLTSVGVPLANVTGLVASNIFQERDAPKYLPALVTAACFGFTGALITGLLGLYMILDNKRRDRNAGVKVKARDVPTLKMRDGPKSPEFRWYL